MDTYSRVMAYLEKVPPAVSGSGGHNATLRVACECFRFGLSHEQAWEALVWFNTNRCSPPWKEHELRHKLADAEKITAQGGQVSQRGHARPQARQHTFVPPARPVRTAAPAVPLIERSAEAEELWWAQVALEHGTTLESFGRD